MNVFHLSLSLGALAAPAVAQATFTDVGSLPGENGSALWSASCAGGVGDAGALNDTATHAVRWSGAGPLEYLGDLPGGPSYSEAEGMSCDGTIVVGMSKSASGEEAFRWVLGAGMVGLGDLPGGLFRSHATATSADGSWTVGFASDALGQRPVRWDAAGLVEVLGTLPGGNGAGQALAITPDGGTIVGWAHWNNGGWPYRWTAASGMQKLGDSLPEMLAGRAEGVSDDGNVIVGFAATPTFQYAFRYTVGGQMQSLGYLPGGTFLATAMDCSGDGSVVVGSNLFHNSGNGNPFFKATIWDTTHGLRELKTVLENDYGLDLQGFQPWVATGISSDGLTITGHGLDSHARTRGFVVTLPPDCPAPASYCSGSPNSAGTSASIGFTGTTSVAANDLVLTVDGATPDRFGLFFYGPEQTSVPFGDGLRCVDGTLFRLPVVLTDGAGSAASAVDNTAPPQPEGELRPGDDWNFQFWYRDPDAGGSGFNTSDGLAAHMCP